MLRCQEDGWVDDPWDSPDPDWVADSLEKLSVVNDGGEPSVTWHLFFEKDPVALAKHRRHQKIALARYGRQALDFWDDKDVSELNEWYEALRELMKGESELAGATEE